jgi:cyclophilin family peptidyl-prolyl cis-trans isomerase
MQMNFRNNVNMVGFRNVPKRRTWMAKVHGPETLESRYALHSGEFPTIVIETNVGNITLNMFDEMAPQTVLNFTNYVKDGDFINAIFHRVVPGFVMQGGGFRSTAEDLCDCEPGNFSATAVSAAQFQEVPTDPPVVNEFSHSNVRGTVAMAKLGGDPNSATNQFFVNLANNSSNLDNQNGGFTVFAEIEDMTVVDQIAALPRRDLRSIFPAGSRLRALEGVATFTSSETGNVAAVRMEGFSGTGVVGGRVFRDTDGDGESDVGEGGITRAEVFVDSNENGIFDPSEEHTMADDSGEFSLSLPAGKHVIRLVPIAGYTQTAAAGNQRFVVDVDIGRGYRERDFGVRYQGGSWQNPRIVSDVDGINGIAPLDALLVINELTNRRFSNATTGALPTVTSRDPASHFYDVSGDKLVTPTDAIRVINALPGSAAAGIVVEDSSSPTDLHSIGVPAYMPASNTQSPQGLEGPEENQDDVSILDQIYAAFAEG